MVCFSTIIKKFEEKGEKTGWTYIDIQAGIAQQLIPNNKKAFRAVSYTHLTLPTICSV